MAQIALPNQLVNGTVADASQVMANFQSIVDVVNGNLDSGNLGALTGTDVTVTDLNGGSNTLNNFTTRFQAGSVQINNVAPDTFTNVHVTFPVTFPGEPLIFTSLITNEPNQWFDSAARVDGSGFDFHVRQTFNDTRSITGAWLAVYIGAFA